MKAVPDARVVLRPRGLLESCDLALRFMAIHAGAYTRVAVAYVLPAFVTLYVLRRWLRVDWEILWWIALALSAFLEGPFTILSGQLGLRSDAGVRQVSRAFARRLVPYSLVLLGAALLQSLAVLLLVVPWLWAAPALVFASEIVLLEGTGAGAMRRSRRLGTGFGYSSRALGLVFLLAFIRVVCVVLAEVGLRNTVGVLLDLRLPVESMWNTGGSPYALVGLCASIPVCAGVRYMSYLDVRTRREGWDLQRRFHGLAERLAERRAA